MAEAYRALVAETVTSRVGSAREAWNEPINRDDHVNMPAIARALAGLE